MNRSSTGLEENVAGLLCYLLTWVTGLVFVLIEKESSFVRFHAMQSLLTSVGLAVAAIVAGWLPLLGNLVAPLIAILAFVLWILLMYKAYQGERFKLPLVGDIAERWTVSSRG